MPDGCGVFDECQCLSCLLQVSIRCCWWASICRGTWATSWYRCTALASFSSSCLGSRSGSIAKQRPTGCLLVGTNKEISPFRDSFGSVDPPFRGQLSIEPIEIDWLPETPSKQARFHFGYFLLTNKEVINQLNKLYFYFYFICDFRR